MEERELRKDMLVLNNSIHEVISRAVEKSQNGVVMMRALLGKSAIIVCSKEFLSRFHRQEEIIIAGEALGPCWGIHGNNLSCEVAGTAEFSAFGDWNYCEWRFHVIQRQDFLSTMYDIRKAIRSRDETVILQLFDIK